MSSYLNEEDSESENEGNVQKNKKEPLSEEEQASVLAMCTSLKTEGNAHFSKSEFDQALEKYTAAVNTLKEAGLPKDCLILLNRSATYLAMKRYVPALNDANQGN
jgi:tetratricopeptide (TPR) repeat protein